MKMDEQKQANEVSNEQIERTKAEIEEFHKLAQIQNKEISSRLEFSDSLNRISKKFIWIFLGLAMILSLVNYYLFPMIYPTAVLFDKLSFSLGLAFVIYLVAVSINLMIAVSQNPNIENYYKSKIKRTCYLVWLLVLFIAVLAFRKSLGA